MSKQEKLILNVIDEEPVIDNNLSTKCSTDVFDKNYGLKSEQCIYKIGCCGGNKPNNTVRIKPRSAGLVGIGLILWIVWNKYYRNSGHN